MSAHAGCHSDDVCMQVVMVKVRIEVMMPQNEESSCSSSDDEAMPIKFLVAVDLPTHCSC